MVNNKAKRYKTAMKCVSEMEKKRQDCKMNRKVGMMRSDFIYFNTPKFLLTQYLHIFLEFSYFNVFMVYIVSLKHRLKNLIYHLF